MTEAPLQILQRFPHSVTLEASRLKWLLVTTGCALFVVLTAILWPPSPNRFYTILAGAVFFAIGALASAVNLIPGAGRLTLDTNGFEITRFFRRRRVRWQDATNFSVWTHKMVSQVSYDETQMKSSLLGHANNLLSGHNTGLPDTYGLSASALADLMTEWRKRALAASTIVRP